MCVYKITLPIVNYKNTHSKLHLCVLKRGCQITTYFKCCFWISKSLFWAEIRAGKVPSLPKIHGFATIVMYAMVAT